MASIAARAREREVGRDRCAGATGRAAGRAREVVGVEDLAAETRFRHAAAREFLQVRLAEDERTSPSQLLYREGVGRGARILHADVAARRRHVGGVEIVLEHERNAVKRAHGRAVASSR